MHDHLHKVTQEQFSKRQRYRCIYNVINWTKRIFTATLVICITGLLVNSVASFVGCAFNKNDPPLECSSGVVVIGGFIIVIVVLIFAIILAGFVEQLWKKIKREAGIDN